MQINNILKNGIIYENKTERNVSAAAGYTEIVSCQIIIQKFWQIISGRWNHIGLCIRNVYLCVEVWFVKRCINLESHLAASFTKRFPEAKYHLQKN